jgi:transposase-like protein
MDQTVTMFFQRRWPNGFVCPSCGHNEHYTISTRQLPLYECRLCRHQTTVTAGTVMDKTRTPLSKWAAAIDLLSSADGVNAKRLASLIDVKHKTAWLMLRKLRQAIGDVEAASMFQGTVHSGLQILAPKSTFVFLPHRHYRCERVVSVSASIGNNNKPTLLKLRHVDRRLLVRGYKELTREGQTCIVSEQVDPGAEATWLNPDRMDRSPLRDCLLEARAWMNRLFHGVGSKYLQSYLDEFCYRWNAATRQNASSRDDWYGLCLRTAS